MEVGDIANVEEQSNKEAPELLTTPADMQNAIPGVVSIGVEAASRDDVVAIIVSAFSDPGLEELRAQVDIPVYGIGEEVFHEAAQGGRPFGIVTVTPDEGLIESFRQKAISLGYEEQYRGVRVTPGDPMMLVKSPDELDAALSVAVQESIDKDGSSAVIMEEAHCLLLRSGFNPGLKCLWWWPSMRQHALQCEDCSSQTVSVVISSLISPRSSAAVIQARSSVCERV